MNATPKHILCAALAFFALIGLLVCGTMLHAFFAGRGTNGYVGKACEQSLVFRSLPLPPQAEGDMPMAVEYRDFGDYYSFIIFRAPAEWQETFRRFYPAASAGDEVEEGMASLARSLAADAGDERIGEFIKARTWHPFHYATSSLSHGMDVIALRDESGEYLMVFFINW